jgi:hypothetical protein
MSTPPTKRWSRKKKIDKILHDELPKKHPSTTRKSNPPLPTPSCYEFERAFIEQLTESEGQIVLKYGMVCASKPEPVVKRASYFPRVFKHYGGAGNPEILANLLNEATENIPNFKGTFVQGIGISTALQKKAQDYTDEVRKSLVEIERLLQIIPAQISIKNTEASKTAEYTNTNTSDLFPKIKLFKNIQFSAPNAIKISPNVTPDEVIAFNKYLKEEVISKLQNLINSSEANPINNDLKDKITKTLDLFQSELFKFIDSEQIRITFKETTLTTIGEFDKNITNVLNVLNSNIASITIAGFENTYKAYIETTNGYLENIKKTRGPIEEVNRLFGSTKDMISKITPQDTVLTNSSPQKTSIFQNKDTLVDTIKTNILTVINTIDIDNFKTDKVYNSQTASSIEAIKSAIKTETIKINTQTDLINNKLDEIKVDNQNPVQILGSLETSLAQFIGLSNATTEISKKLGELNDVFETILKYKIYFRKLIDDLKEFQQTIKADLNKHQNTIQQVQHKLESTKSDTNIKNTIDIIEQILTEYTPLVKTGGSRKKHKSKKRA